MVKKVFAALLLTLFLLGAALASESIPESYDWNRHILDNANVLSTDGKAKMLEQIQRIGTKYNYAVVLVTSSDVENGKYVSFADDTYDKGGYGFDHQKSGILFLIDFNNRRLYMSTTGALIDIVNDAVEEKILDDIGTSATDGNYDDTMFNFLNSLSKYLRADYRAKNEVHFFSFEWLDDLSTMDYAIAIILALALFLGLYYSVSRRYNLKYNTYQYNLAQNAHVELNDREDEFTHQSVTRTRISSPSSSNGRSGGGGGSSTHFGSSGTRHGGGGRSF